MPGWPVLTIRMVPVAPFSARAYQFYFMALDSGAPAKLLGGSYCGNLTPAPWLVDLHACSNFSRVRFRRKLSADVP